MQAAKLLESTVKERLQRANGREAVRGPENLLHAANKQANGSPVAEIAERHLLCDLLQYVSIY